MVIGSDAADQRDQTWEVVGGGDNGGLVVRESRELTSPQEPERLSTGALVGQLKLAGERLHFERLTGTGPDRGWVSISLKGKALLVKSNRRPTESEAAARAKEKLPRPEVVAALQQASEALAAGAKLEAANDAFTAMAAVWGSCKASRPQLLLARGLLLWRWSLLGKALAHLKEADSQGATGASLALLAQKICLSQWLDARRHAEELGRRDVLEVLDHWETAACKMDLFFPRSTAMVPQPAEVMPGIRMTDMLIPISEDVELGARLLLQVDQAGKALSQKPLVLCFHREDESVDALMNQGGLFEPFRAAGVSIIAVGYRGYGFSSGTPSQTSLNSDAGSVCDSLPKLFKDHSLPWPWPGRLVLYGSALGSRVASYLAGVRGSQFFDGGVVLESAWCGSYAPGAEPPPEPQEGPSVRGRFRLRVRNEEMSEVAADVGSLCRKLLDQAGAQHSEVFGHLRGNEDLLRGFDGRLLVLHGDQDLVTPVSHAERLCAAAESASRKLVIMSGKGADTLRADTRYADALKMFFTGS
ncbi:unnamed protein product [Polarella glacialis]|uniref:Serine aminopeptidase S33 domain-containing protein n=1 Tax=Polarella glacialis TaxID=89957 RepID=A0A813L222_POLGL|nr:unnamed protein product [Polarella glacialis]